MLERKLKTLEEELLRNPNNLNAWQELAYDFSRHGNLSGSLRREENLNPLLELLAQEPSNDRVRQLYAAIRGVEICQLTDFQKFERNGNFGESESGQYDLKTGLPLQVTKTIDVDANPKTLDLNLLPPTTLRIISRPHMRFHYLASASKEISTLAREKEYNISLPGIWIPKTKYHFQDQLPKSLKGNNSRDSIQPYLKVADLRFLYALEAEHMFSLIERPYIYFPGSYWMQDNICWENIEQDHAGEGVSSRVYPLKGGDNPGQVWLGTQAQCIPVLPVRHEENLKLDIKLVGVERHGDSLKAVYKVPGEYEREGA